mmetsp:Transcript_16129/g.32680  ORF Transcript_16129/g.32680 Transcript_16129/m.32680 type:complete len:188 (-) Transcript_16129:291-854(-)
MPVTELPVVITRYAETAGKEADVVSAEVIEKVGSDFDFSHRLRTRFWHGFLNGVSEEICNIWSTKGMSSLRKKDKEHGSHAISLRRDIISRELKTGVPQPANDVTFQILTFLEISPNSKYLCTFFNGLCTPLLGTALMLSMNGCNSSPTCVSGKVQTSGAFLSKGLGMVMDFSVSEFHLPLTRLHTA